METGFPFHRRAQPPASAPPDLSFPFTPAQAPRSSVDKVLAFLSAIRYPDRLKCVSSAR